jgi:hypothetical protein
MSGTEQTRALLARHFTWRTSDRVSYDVGRLCQRAGVRYRGAVTPDEREAVEAVTLREGRRPLRSPQSSALGGAQRLDESRAGGDWPDERAEVWGGVLAALVVLGVLAVVGLLAAPLLLWARFARGRRGGAR